VPVATHTKSALFVDFDNVYIGLLNLDARIAELFATDPGSWVRAIAGDDGERRFLIRNCYINPSVFSKYRAAWTRAGFRVIDCPSLTQQGKSSTDINLVLDAVDVLASPVEVDEFFIASADADFTSLVHRIRAADRLTTVIVAGGVASAYRNMADHVIEADELMELIGGGANGDVANAQAPAATKSERSGVAERAVLDYIRGADGPVNAASFAHRARMAAPDLTADWEGFGSFRLWVESLGDQVGTQFGTPPGWLWDPARFTAADVPQPAPTEVGLVHRWSSLQTQVTRVTDIPRLTTEQFAAVFRALADDVKVNRFSRTETSKRVRDALAAGTDPVSRAAISFVISGLLLSHTPLDGAVDATSLAVAWAGNAEALCRGARMEFEENELLELRAWMSGGVIASSD
jgi:hypothetical protein